MELRCLTDDAALVRAVKKLNSGVLPVQPPAFCYRRAEKDANRLSWGTVMSDDVLSGAAIADLEIERDGQRVVHLRTEDGTKVTSVRLHVHEGNEDGLAFYKALGFAEEARLEDYYRHLEPRTALVMQYSL
ncbi:hypothetical protein BBO99_00008605 [Phytophthora kernoviae]|uniref:N-acetyltransferase domain-containing protein n=2 Tax=Phytophthora kernoviae TaxID=325452 RepID=A0A421ET39_9STRA|nr:hypothetical protein G195_010853 [Phytophthora kernoviae 00238/432]KAG2506891.1 hypothetical protein JM16_008330 [Phytophthora kernoviae]KAG2508713.1 hypothetical protein JM18_008313 [Phytophthora kernoviae]RLM96898.1 hypothetical protein BBI17_008431 [Phytophthora kernoviae]RLN75005.1 hypothetical protein BBO99_00008605 [Phytophthora kernoviae]